MDKPNRKELIQRINGYNSLLEKMKINPDEISILVVNQNIDSSELIRKKLTKIYDELTICYERELDYIKEQECL